MGQTPSGYLKIGKISSDNPDFISGQSGFSIKELPGFIIERIRKITELPQHETVNFRSSEKNILHSHIFRQAPVEINRPDIVFDSVQIKHEIGRFQVLERFRRLSDQIPGGHFRLEQDIIHPFEQLIPAGVSQIKIKAAFD